MTDAEVERWRPLLDQYARIAELCELIRLVTEPPAGGDTATTDRTSCSCSS